MKQEKQRLVNTKREINKKKCFSFKNVSGYGTKVQSNGDRFTMLYIYFFLLFLTIQFQSIRVNNIFHYLKRRKLL